jgi:multisubunit Na+/H+ antiporter MnhG subunit
MTIILIGVVLGLAAEVGLWKFCDWFIRVKDLEDQADS